MILETVDISDISQDPANVRKHSERNLESIAASLRAFGQQKPIVVDKRGVILAGNGTYEAARRIGWDKIQITRTDLSGTLATAYAIADNRTAELAEWDDTALAEQLRALQSEEFDLKNVGYTDDEVQQLIDGIGDDLLGASQVTEDEIPEPPVEPITKPGDLWLLGDHRLLCGDSTKAEDVERLMAGAKADLCFTSPPYSDQRDYHGGDLAEQSLSRFIDAAESKCELFAVNLGMSRKNNEVNEYWNDYITAAKRAGLKFLSWNIWDRSGFGYTVGQATAMFTVDHEWILVFGWQRKDLNKTVKNKDAGRKIDGTRRNKDGTTTASESVTNTHRQLGTVFRCNVVKSRNAETKDHPAVFPVALPAAYIEACCNLDGSVYEPFCGSGTTLIAAEQLGRKCYGMEISPQYCDVIVKRWETLTGRVATRA